MFVHTVKFEDICKHIGSVENFGWICGLAGLARSALIHMIISSQFIDIYLYSQDRISYSMLLCCWKYKIGHVPYPQLALECSPQACLLSSIFTCFLGCNTKVLLGQCKSFEPTGVLQTWHKEGFHTLSKRRYQDVHLAHHLRAKLQMGKFALAKLSQWRSLRYSAVSECL